ncbi:MAG: nicotinate phosphoribosyltransferase [Actinomycetota bacterium]|nr:nicotinate phosphoribosyltransferase [Actinomycetota bacterium]
MTGGGPATEWVNERNSALFTDLYELTMAASYHASGMNGPATFDLFVRDLPRQRNFLIACGLHQALGYLETLKFDRDSIAYLRSLGLFDDEFLAFLANLSFTGDVSAVPEGEAVFAGEPLLRVSAPLIEAQIVETFLLNCVSHQTMIASKAARLSIACGDKSFVDFSARRDHGADAALKGARAAFVGGAIATSNVLAGQIYGIPVTGTMAHSYVMAFESELDAFRSFVRDFPNNSILLIDTFDVLRGAANAVLVAEEAAVRGARIKGVRIDSGDLGEMARAARKILDEAGLTDVQIFLSGDLDEHRIWELLAEGVPVDAFGVGTQLGTSGDEPALGAVYKLVEDNGRPKIKLSTGKVTLPGRKQVYRLERKGRYERDVIALEDEYDPPPGRALLERVMSGGRRVRDPAPLGEARARCEHALASLPQRLLTLEAPTHSYDVTISPALEELVMRVHERS